MSAVPCEACEKQRAFLVTVERELQGQLVETQCRVQELKAQLSARERELLGLLVEREKRATHALSRLGWLHTFLERVAWSQTNPKKSEALIAAQTVRDILEALRGETPKAPGEGVPR